MSNQELAAFYTELDEREQALEEARAHKGDSLEALERYREVSTEFAEWRMGLRTLAKRPGWIFAHELLHGAEATAPLVEEAGHPPLNTLTVEQKKTLGATPRPEADDGVAQAGSAGGEG